MNGRVGRALILFGNVGCLPSDILVRSARVSSYITSLD